MSKILRLVLPLLLVCLAACQSLGLAPADSIDSKLAYSYGVHTAVLQTADAMLKSGALSRADAIQVLNLADQSRALLDSARAVESTNIAAAGNKLALATSILSQLQAYLNARGMK